MPQRIQRKRRTNWQMPLNTIYVGRPSKWGNPFTFSGKVAPKDKPLVHEYLKKCYKCWVNGEIDFYDNGELIQPPSRNEIKIALKGKNLACWCGLGDCCHADVLLEIANE